MTFELLITNGASSVDFISSDFKLEDSGLELGYPKQAGVASYPLAGGHGTMFQSVYYSNRSIKLTFSVYGETYADLTENLRKLTRLIFEANKGNNVDLKIQAQDSANSYLRILSGTIKQPNKLFSLEGVHYKSGDTYIIKDITLDLITAPFFSDEFSGVSIDDVSLSSIYSSSIDNYDNINLVDIAGDTTTETILKFIGNYSTDGINKIFIGCGSHSLETNLATAITGTVGTTIYVDEDYTNKLLVPFVITIDSEDMRVTDIYEGEWTVERGYNSSTPATHVDDSDVTIEDNYELDADVSDSSVRTPKRDGIVDTADMSGGATAGSGFALNQILYLDQASLQIKFASIRITGVDDSGGVETFDIIDGGEGYGTGTTTAVGGTGTNCIVNILTIFNMTSTTTASTSADLNSNYLDIDYKGNGPITLVEWEYDRTHSAVVNQMARFIGRSIELVDVDGGWSSNVNYRICVGYFKNTTAVTAEALDISETLMDVDDDYTEEFDPTFIITIDSEKMRVTHMTASVWTIERGYDGTSPATHTTSTTINIEYFVELNSTSWSKPTTNTGTLFDIGSLFFPTSSSKISAPNLIVRLEAEIDPDIATVTQILYLDFIKILPVGNGFRLIDNNDVCLEDTYKLVDDSRRVVPYVEEYDSEFMGEVTVNGTANPVRLLPENSGNSLHLMFETDTGYSVMGITANLTVYTVGQFLNLVE